LAVQAATQQRRRYRATLKAEVVILRGQGEVPRNGDVHYPFRQSSDLLYLSACPLPDIVLLLSSEREVLLIPKADEHQQVWLGNSHSLGEIQARYGFEEVAHLGDFNKLCEDLCKGADLVISSDGDLKEQLKLRHPCAVRPWRPGVELAGLRVIKNGFEIELIQMACDATSSAHQYTMERAKAGMEEWQVRDLFIHQIKTWGLRELSFPIIAAAGKGAATLHYTREDGVLKKGDLLLLDAGGEWQGYAGDITRTWPIAGPLTGLAQELYQLVLEAQMQATALVRPGVWISELQECVVKVLAKGLVELGILKGSSEELIEAGAVRLFYPHGCSHQIGLDVHDVSPKMIRPDAKSGVRSDQLLQENMVISMEPGLYFIEALICSEKQRKKLEPWVNWNKAESLLKLGGIRIEDDLLLTATGHRELTQVPKKIDDLHAIRS
jgi:Xaa-Pro aminopeptidase